MFIKLTMFIGYYPKSPHHKPIEEVYINPANITYFNPQVMTVYRHDQAEDNQTPPEEKITVTIISFAAGLHEESDSVTVLESPAEILKRIPGRKDG
jgi:hypothetical protein